MKAKIAHWLRRLAIMALLIYAGLVVLVFVEQRTYIYSPRHLTEEISLQQAKQKGFEPWRNRTGELIGWERLAKNNTNHNQIFVFHGNGGAATYRFPLGDEIQAAGAFDVYLLEYPGYGSRLGAPSESKIFKAAEEGVDLLRDHPLYLVGESLGSGVACYIAGKYPTVIGGVFLVAPYDELLSLAKERMPFFPVSLMLLDRFRSTFHLEKYHGPVAVILGGDDHVVPNRFGHHLYDKYEGPKKLWVIPGADHADLFDREDAIPRWREIINFWRANPESNTN